MPNTWSASTNLRLPDFLIYFFLVLEPVLKEIDFMFQGLTKIQDEPRIW